ncbi:MAG: roadblock/LC7 domain-containing protein [Candidatus Ranarchaeia archaeon]
MFPGKPREEIESLLRELHEKVPQVTSSAIVSIEGLPIASLLSETMDEMRIAAMTAAMLSMGENASTTLNKGTLKEIIVSGNKGYIISLSAGPNAVLTVSASKEGLQLGLIYHFMKKIADQISEEL